MYHRSLRSLVRLIAVACVLGQWGFAHAEDAVPPSYQIGPNDVLNIYVWKEPELTRDITVMSDGRITFPLIGELMAQGTSVTDLKNVMLEKLKKFIEAPEITVIVKESKSKIIFTVGKLNKPGPYPLLPDMTVLQAIATAGGFAQWAEEKSIVIVRREDKKEVQLHFNYKDFIGGKNPEQNILLKPGDTIVVP